jgi:hypothetical protein
MPTRAAPQKNQPKNKLKVPLLLAVGMFTVIIFLFALVPRLHEQSSPVHSIYDSFNKNQYSINDPASIWAVVNKGRNLSANYIPPDLIAPNVELRLPATDPEMQVRTVAASSLQQMFKDEEGDTASTKRDWQLILSRPAGSAKLNFVLKIQAKENGWLQIRINTALLSDIKKVGKKLQATSMNLGMCDM